MEKAVWRLRRTSTSHVVECRISAPKPRLFSLVVVWGSETLLCETYADSTTAHSRASELRNRLLERGDWQPARTAVLTTP
jgi:hypothetical protein